MARGFQGIPTRDPVGPAAYGGTILAASSSLTLPDLTQYTYLPEIIAPSNATTVPASMKTADGWSVATGFSAGTAGQIAPLAAPIPRGVWGSLTITPPTLATITGSATLTALGTAQIDTNLVVVIYQDGTNVYAVAINTASWQAGSPATLGTYNAATGAGVWKVSTTSFVAGFTHTGSNYTFRAGSINTSTLAITLGGAATTGTAVFDTPVQCSAQYYAFMQNNASGVRGVYVNGTTSTIGTAAASGSIADTNSGNFRLVACGNGTQTCLVAYLATGGGTATTRALTLAQVTIATTTGNASVASASGTGSNVLSDAGLKTVHCVNAGSPSGIVSAVTSTGAVLYAFSASSAAVPAAFSAGTTRASETPQANLNYGTWIYKTGGMQSYGFQNAGNAQTVIFGHLTTGIYAASWAVGPTLSVGSTLTYAAAKNLVTDMDGLGTVYAISTGLTDEIGVSGTTLTTASSVAVTATAVRNRNLYDKAVRYSGVWYSWTLPTLQAIVTPTAWLFTSGNNLILCGPMK